MDNNIQLPLWETVTRSFLYVIKNIKTFFKICSVFIVLWILEIATNFPSLCLIDEHYCRTDTTAEMMTILLFLASTAIGVSFIRYIILRQETNWFRLKVGMYNLRFIGYTFLLAAMVIIPTALMLMIIDNAKHSNASPVIINFLHSVGFATLIGLTIFCFRLYLVYAASAIDDRNMSLAKSYILTTGNMLKIFAGQILLMIPTALMVIIVLNLYNITEWNVIGQSVFLLLGLLISFFDSTVKASYYSHLYQYFTYKKKQIETETKK